MATTMIRRTISLAMATALAGAALTGTPAMPTRSGIAQAATGCVPASLVLTVAEPNGKPIGNEDVFGSIWLRGVPRSFAGFTDVTGKYRMEGLCANSKVEYAASPRFFLYDRREVSLKPGSNSARLDLVPAAEIKITTYNTNALRTPAYTLTNLATKVRIRTWEPNDLDLRAGSGSRSKNPWDVFKVAAGLYQVSASAHKALGISFRNGKTRMVDAKAGTRTSISFSINPGGALKGKVTPKPKKSRKVDGYGHVCALSTKGFFACSDISKNGYYTFRHLPAGKYKVHFTVGRSKTKIRADYYRAGTSRVRPVTVKDRRTTKLKTVRLTNRVVRPLWV